jgi:hypothetical protein
MEGGHNAGDRNTARAGKGYRISPKKAEFRPAEARPERPAHASENGQFPSLHDRKK